MREADGSIGAVVDADVRAPPIVCEGLSVVYGDRPALWDVTWEAPSAGLVGIVGPNGAGKSTLIRAILGLAPIFEGRVRLFGGEVRAMRHRIAYVPQRAGIDWDFPATARDVVAMGLYRRLGLFRRVSREAKRDAERHLAAVGIADLADRPIGDLSGGQQQRVLIARALAQETPALALDEPFVGVDQPSEAAILDLFARLEAEGRLVLCVHHELDTVARRFGHAVLLATRLVAAGPVERVMTPELIARAYATRAVEMTPTGAIR